MKKVLITSKEFASFHWEQIAEVLQKNHCIPIFNPHKRAMKADEICALAREHAIEGILVYSSSDEMNQTVFENCPDLKVVSRHGVGVENIDLEAAARAGVEVRRTDRLNDCETVADLTFGLLINLARKVSEVDQTLRVHGQWYRPIGKDVWGKTIGLVGFGRIGKAVAKRAMGFGMKILVYDPYITSLPGFEHSDIQLVTLDELLKESDFISLHSKLTSETRNMIGLREMSLMKKSAYLINCARAGLVDQVGLIIALETELIAGIGVDVFIEEPAINDPLLLKRFKNVVVTSHIGSYTIENLTQMDLLAVENMLEVLYPNPDSHLHT